MYTNISQHGFIDGGYTKTMPLDVFQKCFTKLITSCFTQNRAQFWEDTRNPSVLRKAPSTEQSSVYNRASQTRWPRMIGILQGVTCLFTSLTTSDIENNMTHPRNLKKYVVHQKTLNYKGILLGWWVYPLFCGIFSQNNSPRQSTRTTTSQYWTGKGPSKGPICLYHSWGNLCCMRDRQWTLGNSRYRLDLYCLRWTISKYTFCCWHSNEWISCISSGKRIVQSTSPVTKGLNLPKPH